MPRHATDAAASAASPPKKKSKGRKKRAQGANLTELNALRLKARKERTDAAIAATPETTLAEDFWFTGPPLVIASENGYSREIAAKLCGYVSQGVSLRRCCTPRLSPLGEHERPSLSMATRWLFQFDEFRSAMHRAQEMAADAFAAEIVDIADSGYATVPMHKRNVETGLLEYDANGEPVIVDVMRPLDSDVIQHNKLRIEARKWYAAKMAPKRYGERVTQEHTSPADAPVLIGNGNLRGLSDAELAQVEQLMRKALKHDT